MDQPNATGRRRGLPAPILGLLAATVLSATVWGALRWTAPATFRGTAYLPPDAAADFRLTDHTGGTLRMSDLRGRVVLVVFGYVNCPDVCPLTLSKVRRALDEVDAEPGEVRVLLVTVDPERDTPEALARYVTRFGTEVTGVTGPRAEIDRLAAAYGVHSAPDPTGGHGMVTHTGAIFGIDRDGLLRVLQRPENPEEEIAADIRTLLRE